jgi:hypothetical protein
MSQPTPSSATPSAPPSAATAARCRQRAHRRPGRHPAQGADGAQPRVDWAAVTDVLYGCANQAGEDNRNVARMAALLAGLPSRCPAPPSTACAARAWTPWARPRAPSRPARRADDRRRRGEHEPRALRHAQGRSAFSRKQRGLRHHHRLALRQQADEGAVRRRLHARDGRERGHRLQDRARGAGPHGAGQPAQGGGGAEGRPPRAEITRSASRRRRATRSS